MKKTRQEYVSGIETALSSTKHHAQLMRESLDVLDKLSKLPAATVELLLNKAASQEACASLKTGQQPDMFIPASASYVNVLLWGAPGRGKSVLADVIAKQHVKRVGGIFEQIVCPEDTQVSILAGSFQPAEGGGWKWIDGPVTRVMREGGACVMDELAHLSPEAQTWLLAAMDTTPTLTLPSGETIVKKPVWFVATQNDTPASLLPPLASRLPIQQKVNLPFSWAWLGEFAPLAERDLTTQETADLRPWAALRRMTDAGVPLEHSVKLLWPDTPSQLSAIKLAMDNS